MYMIGYELEILSFITSTIIVIFNHQISADLFSHAVILFSSCLTPHGTTCEVEFLFNISNNIFLL